jgi:hypothetical protein
MDYSQTQLHCNRQFGSLFLGSKKPESFKSPNEVGVEAEQVVSHRSNGTTNAAENEMVDLRSGLFFSNIELLEKH